MNTSLVLIRGDNFGPDRIFDGTFDNITILDGPTVIPCIVEGIINHTTIHCQTAGDLETKDYILSLTIGGQNIALEFEFRK